MKTKYILYALSTILTLIMAGVAGASNVDIYSKSGIGDYLVDENGMALYYFSPDGGNMISTCYGGCLAKWSPFFAGKSPGFGPSLDPSNFNYIIRADDIQQTTYKGWPLYHYTSDLNPGDTNGDGLDGQWSLMRS